MSSENLSPVVFLMGPTAAGKTSLALALHDRFPVDVISVDAAQVYRGMDVGTAKPTPAERKRVPHRLIDIRDPAETYSAAEFCTDALSEIQQTNKSGRIPLLVGGTMFYFHALEYGLSPLPSADADVRSQLMEESQHQGWAALHKRLSVHDPETAARIHPNDAQRIQRALEVVELTGRGPSDWHRQTPPVRLPHNLIKIGIYPRKRSLLHERIEKRFDRMLECGLIAEVETLHARDDLGPELPSIRTVGYRQVWQYLTGLLSYNEMTRQGVSATRHLAKRQLTWLRSYDNVHYLDSAADSLETRCIDHLVSNLDRKQL